MVDVFGFEIPVDVPSMSFGLGSMFWFVVVLFILFMILAGVGFFFIHRLKIYKYKIVVYENIAGQGYQRSFVDRAKILKLGDGGEELFYLLKKKVYRSAYGRKMGKNEYWYAIGQDGYWYNILLGDLDAKKGMLDIEPVDKDLRYTHVAIRRNIIDRYKKQSVMDKYATVIMSGIFVIIMIVGLWFLLDKIADINASSAEVVRLAAETQKETKVLISALNNLKGGAGFVPAG